MEKELIELYDVVRTAADAAVEGEDGEEERCLDAMKELKKFPVNYNILVSSQVGKSLRKLTKHPREKIKTLASDIVEIWKQIIVRETMKNKKPENPTIQKPEKPQQPPISESPLTMKNKNLETPANLKPEKPETMKTKSSENLDQRPPKVQKTHHPAKPERSTPAPPKLSALIYTKDPDRDQLREAIANALRKVINEVDSSNDDIIADVKARDPYRVAVQVETALFEKWGSAKGSNKMKYRSVKFNITDSKNPDFRRRVLLGEFPPESVPELTPEDMASDERKKANEKIKEKALFNSQRSGPPVASTNAFKCGKCGKKEATYYQLQTRSADEPMTAFITCTNCDNRWKA